MRFSGIELEGFALTYAPVGLPTYTRLDHLRRTVGALEKNRHADKYSVYVFSDGAKPGDEKKVSAVRRYLRSVKSFKRFEIIERDENCRVSNARGGLASLLETFGRTIFLEDDIVTSPGFLEYVNQGLDIYSDTEEVFAICGYTPPVRMDKYYDKDVYFSPRFAAWGYGIWKNRYEQIQFDRQTKRTFLERPELLERYVRGGEDLVNMLRREASGEIDALDAKIMFTMFVLGKRAIAPTISLTRNIGHDGSGIHCGITERFEVDLSLSKDEIVFDCELRKNAIVDELLYCFRSQRPFGFDRRVKSAIVALIDQMRNRGSN